MRTALVCDRPHGRPRATNDAAGFTLIELLVVLAIIGMMLAAMPLAFTGGRTGTQIKAAALGLADDLRALRATAIVGRVETSLALNLATGQYQELPGGSASEFPTGVATRFVGPRNEIHNGTAEIRFFPDGSSSGGKIGLSSGSMERWVAVQWLSGKVSVDD
jgi:general secretion pathway protein H